MCPIPRLLQCTCLVSLFKSDLPLKIIDDYYVGRRLRCVVCGTNGDLVVLAVRILFWDVTVEEGSRVFGHVITQEDTGRPRLHASEGATNAFMFLRRLHGYADARGGDET